MQRQINCGSNNRSGIIGTHDPSSGTIGSKQRGMPPSVGHPTFLYYCMRNSVSYLNQFGGNPFVLPPPPPPKRNVFISSFHGDRGEVNAFIYHWARLQNVFTPKALCTFDNDDFIDSDNPDYVMGRIRQKYIGDATVTIVLVGKCTHSRRYVDWEIKASLRRGEYTPNGLLAYVLPSAMPRTNALTGLSTDWPVTPPRLSANWSAAEQQRCYARYYTMPNSAQTLRQHIEDAFRDRTTRAHLIKNDSDMMKNNTSCSVCGVTH
jgi:hypothetical protein